MLMQGNLPMENAPLHMNAMEDSEFMDTNFSFHDMSSLPNVGAHPDTKMEDDSASYTLSVTDFSHGGATAVGGQDTRGDPDDAAAMEHTSNNNGNEEGSVESPESSRPRGTSLAEGCDEFGINTTGAADGTDLGKQKEDKNEVPAWTELKTKAGKERKRLPLACIACRRKKIRCSGEKPACKHCLRSRIPCVYKVATRKAAPRTDYMAMLDKRLKRMEERIIKIAAKDDQDVNMVVRAQVKPAIPGMTPTKPANPRKRPAEEAFGTELEAWATSAKTNNQGVLPASLLAQEQEESRLLIEGSDALPSQEIQEHLAEVFFDNIYGQAYHVLHKPSYMRKLK